MFHIVLFQPEIPQNTGNIVRTAAATGSILHLVKPLGFQLDEAHLKRAGLDYWDKTEIVIHESQEEFLQEHKSDRLFFLSSKGAHSYMEVSFQDGDYLIFGRETKGIDEDILKAHQANTLRLPMKPGIRCLNLSNAVAIVVYEALRQNNFPEFQLEGKLKG